MKIGYIDGFRLKRALMAGGKRLIQSREQLNKINVFPVADSDTGTNMAGTISSVLQSLQHHSHRSIGVTTRAAADAALMGARGNSGAILAQFFHGLAEELHDKARITSRTFAVAVKNSVSYAYQAMTAPKEGTILTVIKQWGTHLSDSTSRSSDIAHALYDSLKAAKEALKSTKDKLPSLKKADVVDAGALGFVHLVEGIHHYVTSGTLREAEELPELEEEAAAVISSENEKLTFTYCTECMLEGSNIDAARVREAITPLGDSIIVAGSGSKVRVHIHTDSPNALFRTVEQFGSIRQPKADDMRKQFAQAHTAHGEIALVVDSACDLPQEVSSRPDIAMVPLSLHLGQRSFLDKIGITPQQYYELLSAHPESAPTTSQPSPQEFRKQLDFLAQHYRHVIVLSISSALSGTYNAACSAASATEKAAANGATVHVVDTRNVAVGIGLIAREVLRLIDEERDIEEIVSTAHALARRTKLYVMVPSVELLIRGGRLSKSKGALARLLGLVPLIEISPEGSAEPFGVALSPKSGLKRLERRVARELSAGEQTAFAYAHVNNERDAHRLAERLAERFQSGYSSFTTEVAPVLASHTGIGTVAVSFITPERNGPAG